MRCVPCCICDTPGCPSGHAGGHTDQGATSDPPPPNAQFESKRHTGCCADPVTLLKNPALPVTPIIVPLDLLSAPLGAKGLYARESSYNKIRSWNALLEQG